MKAEVNGALQFVLVNPGGERETVEWFAVATEPMMGTQKVEWDSPRPQGLKPNGVATITLYDIDGNPAKGATIGDEFLTVRMPACVTLKGRWPSAGRIAVGGCAEVYLGEEAAKPYVAALKDQLEEF